MDFTYLFTSLQGRVNRAKWWVGQVVLFVVFAVCAFLANQTTIGPKLSAIIWIVLYLPAYPLAAKRFHDRNKRAETAVVGYVVSIIAAWLLSFGPVTTNPREIEVPFGDVYLTFYWNTNTLGLVCLLVLIGVAVWFLVELGMLKGTSGPNRFGADPLTQPVRQRS